MATAQPSNLVVNGALKNASDVAVVDGKYTVTLRLYGEIGSAVVQFKEKHPPVARIVSEPLARTRRLADCATCNGTTWTEVGQVRK